MSTPANASIRLDHDEIHLWLTNYMEVAAERLLATYRKLLSADERAKESRFHFERDQRRYLVTRALVRTTLSRYLPIQPQEWLFETNEYGCPYAANAAARQAKLSFNLSHTHSLIVLGITQNRTLGVDVENFRTQNVPADLARLCFSTEEADELLATSCHRMQFRFFEYWTLKESYIKARGMGLRLPLDKFRFHYPTKKSVTMNIDAGLCDDPSRWLLWQIRIDDEYLLAICARRTSTNCPALVSRRLLPLYSEEYLDLNPVRTSE